MDTTSRLSWILAASPASNEHRSHLVDAHWRCAQGHLPKLHLGVKRLRTLGLRSIMTAILSAFYLLALFPVALPPVRIVALQEFAKSFQLPLHIREFFLPESHHVCHLLAGLIACHIAAAA